MTLETAIQLHASGPESGHNRHVYISPGTNEYQERNLSVNGGVFPCHAELVSASHIDPETILKRVRDDSYDGSV